MKTYNVVLDIKRIRAFFSLSQEQFAEAISVSRLSITRYERSLTFPDNNILESIYSFAYGKHGEKLNLNKAKEQFYFEDCKGKKLLFHGAKGSIEGNIDIYHSLSPNDFGDGFYAGESLFQAASWVCLNKKSSVYCFYFDDHNLKHIEFNVGRKWMYAILYYRGALTNRVIPEEIKSIIKEVENSDYLIAPIADNEMYRILNKFINNEISDEACIHALAATNLGMQYVFKTMKACQRLEFVDRLYLCHNEREDYGRQQELLSENASQKNELAMIEYNRKGLFFNELFKRI